MTVEVDLFLLETWQRFEDLCFHLARAEYGKRGLVVKMARTWDGGRDVAGFMCADDEAVRPLALQCKFTRSLDSDTKRSITDSLDAAAKLPPGSRPETYILCLPVDPTAPFLDWYREEVAARGFDLGFWGRAEILARLHEHPHVFQTFFYRVFAELEKAFVTDDLELRQVNLDPECEWRQPDMKVLAFCSTGKCSSDLVLDVIVRNRGRLEALLTAISAEIGVWAPNPAGLPPPGLLLPKITYGVSIRGGRPGNYQDRCEPPLIISPGAHERFKIRITDTGATWSAVVQVGLDYCGKVLPLPCMRLTT